MVIFKFLEFMEIQQIEEYIAFYKETKSTEDLWVSHCISQNNIEDVIKCAVYAENHLGKMNGHQKRLNKESLKNFTLKLIEIKTHIEKVTSFSELLYLIETNKVWGIGELACYDTAYRIGAKLGIEPDAIYLHAGTRKGAEEILNRKLKHKLIKKDDLPTPFHDNSLSNSDIENFLCIYKNLIRKKKFRC